MMISVKYTILARRTTNSLGHFTSRRLLVQL